MTPFNMSPSLMWQLIGLAAGLALLVIGLRGRRVGDTPFCRRCGYDLTGRAGQRCPECGNDLAFDAIVIGRRRRRWFPLALGLIGVLTVGGGIGLLIYGRVKQVDWYRHYPVAILSQQAQRDDVKAIVELFRRLEVGALKGRQLGSVIDTALIRYTLAPPSVAWFWTAFLRFADIGGALTPAQRDRFYFRTLPKLFASEVVARAVRLTLTKPVGACLAFDVSATRGNEEFNFGRVHWPAGTAGLQCVLLQEAKSLPPKQPGEILGSLRLTLRAYRETAGTSPGCPDPWHGELVLDVPYVVVPQNPVGDFPQFDRQREIPVEDQSRLR